MNEITQRLGFEIRPFSFEGGGSQNQVGRKERVYPTDCLQTVGEETRDGQVGVVLRNRNTGKRRFYPCASRSR